MCEHDGTIQCLRKVLGEALHQDTDGGEMHRITLMTMVQELEDQDTYIKKLENLSSSSWRPPKYNDLSIPYDTYSNQPREISERNSEGEHIIVLFSSWQNMFHL